MSVKSHHIWFFYGKLAPRRKNPKPFLVVWVFPYCLVIIPVTSWSLLGRSRVAGERTRLGNRERKRYTMKWWSFLKVSISKSITYKSIYLNTPPRPWNQRTFDKTEHLCVLWVHLVGHLGRLRTESLDTYHFLWTRKVKTHSLSWEFYPQCFALLQEGHSLLWEIVTHG